MKAHTPGGYPGRLSRWDAIMTLKSFSDLELIRVDHTDSVFQQLGALISLTRLGFISNSKVYKYQQT